MLLKQTKSSNYKTLQRCLISGKWYMSEIVKHKHSICVFWYNETSLLSLFLHTYVFLKIFGIVFLVRIAKNMDIS